VIEDQEGTLPYVFLSQPVDRQGPPQYPVVFGRRKPADLSCHKGWPFWIDPRLKGVPVLEPREQRDEVPEPGVAYWPASRPIRSIVDPRLEPRLSNKRRR